MMKKGDTYKGFKVLEVVENVKDCSCPAIWLVHEKTGMEIFHVLKDEEENLFSLIFRTPTESSNGVAHIIEHSVLCGSEKYPLKDPFIRLSNQSMATYLNAFTTPDYTAYPSSSVVKADYFYNFSVYADAVFFPLLKEEAFMQEGHRIEFNENGKPEISGVVYNEMKGKYSMYESVISNAIDDVVLSDTRYIYDAGGDPIEIPNLTYAQYKAFHKKHYTPANCLVFLYGNIPTQEQLDFIDENVLSRIKNPGKRIKFSGCKKGYEIPKKAHVYGPANENETKDTVCCAWRIDSNKDLPKHQYLMELTFLNNLLWGSDSSPISKALLDSGLGIDVSPQTGIATSLQYQSATCGLRGVDAKDAAKVKKVIYDALKKLSVEGLSDEAMEKMCMSFEFFNRHISRFSGPQSLSMMRRCVRGWIYGDKPWESLELCHNFEILKRKLEDDPKYLGTMIRRYFLDNPKFSLVTASPSKKWLSQRTKNEKENLRRILEEKGESRLLSKHIKMVEFQRMKEDVDKEKLIPKVSFDQIDTKVKDCVPVHSKIKGVDFFATEEQTNGIAYINLFFTMDNLTPEEYKYVSLVANYCTNVGYGNVSWSESDEIQQRITGAISAHTKSLVRDSLPEKILEKKYVSRDWFVFGLCVLERKLKESLDLLSCIISETDFSDTDRLMDLIKSDLNSAKSSLSSNAIGFARGRSKRKFCRSSVLSELWDGLTSVGVIKELSEKNPGDVKDIFSSIFKKIMKNGSIIHVVGTKEGISLTKKLVPDFIDRMNLKEISERPNFDNSELIKLTELPGEIVNGDEDDNPDIVDEVVLINGTVGTAYSSLESTISEKDRLFSMSECVFCHNLSNTDLWDAIRTKGGAYGVYFNSNGKYGFSCYGTYRDPQPFESVRNIKDTIINSTKKDFSQEDVDKSILGFLAVLIEPETPYDRANGIFMAKLLGGQKGGLEKNIKKLLSIKTKDIKKVAEKYSKQIQTKDDRFCTVVFCPKERFLPENKENTRKIIDLQL